MSFISPGRLRSQVMRIVPVVLAVERTVSWMRLAVVGRAERSDAGSELPRGFALVEVLGKGPVVLKNDFSGEPEEDAVVGLAEDEGEEARAEAGDEIEVTRAEGELVAV